MDDSMFDSLLRSALLDATRMEWAHVLEEPQPEPHFSARYLREREKLLKDPFGYAKRKTRPLWKKAVHLAASILLVVGISLGGILAISPEARAWVVEQLSMIWGDKYAFFTVPEHRNEVDDVSHYQPTFIPDGFELIKEDSSSKFFFLLVYKNEAGGYIDYESASLSGSHGFDFIVDNEHCDSYEIQINGKPATLMLSNAKNWPSHLVWIDGEANIAHCITATLDYKELIQIAESVTYIG